MLTNMTARVARLEDVVRETEPMLPVRCFIETEYGVPVGRLWTADELEAAGYAIDPQVAIQVVDASVHHHAGEEAFV